MTNEKALLLAEVAEKYYLKGKTQTEIANKLGVDRSMVSRMLAEAKKEGIVRIQINRSIERNYSIEEDMRSAFNLKEIFVVSSPPDFSVDQIVERMGSVGAYYLNKTLQNMQQFNIGTTWGTSVDALVRQLEFYQVFPESNVIQLVGALSADKKSFDGQSIVQRLTEALGSKVLHLNAPFILDSPETANLLLSNASIKDVFEKAKTCDIVLLGVGSVDNEFSSLFQAGHVKKEEMEWLAKNGAVGDVCGLHFDINGNPRGLDFQSRLITISKENLIKIPIRFAISGGAGKAKPILGAIQGDYINALVTDENTAKDVLNLYNELKK